MASDADILAAAILGRVAHDLRNKASALVGARDLLANSESNDERVKAATEILGEGEVEMAELADAWSSECRGLYAPSLVTATAESIAAKLESCLGLKPRLEVEPELVVRVDEQVLQLILERVAARVSVGELVIRREDGFGLSWLVIEAIADKSGVVGRSVAESSLLKMLDAHPLKKAPAWVFGFRLRLD